MLMASENNDIAFRKAEDKQHFLVPFPLLTFFKTAKGKNSTLLKLQDLLKYVFED